MAIRETLELDVSKARAQILGIGTEIDALGKKQVNIGGDTTKLTAAQTGLAGVNGELNKMVPAQNAAADAATKHAASAESLNVSMRAMSTYAMVAGAGLLALGAVGVVSALDLGKAFQPIGTLLGNNTQQFKSLKSALEDVIATSPQSPDEIGASAYTILSAGITGTTNVVNALTASQKLSLAGLGSLAEATDLVTSGMNAFKSEGLSANEVAQLLFGTITLGKTTTADLAQGFGQIAPLTNAVGVSMHDMLAAVAALTVTGMDASVAYTGLRGIFQNILKPTADAAQTAHDLGIEFNAAHLAAVGLPKFLNEIATAAQGDTQSLTDLFGSVEAANAVLALTGPQAEAFAKNLKQIDEAGKGLKPRADEVEQSFGNLVKTFKNLVEVKLASAMEPVIPVLKGIVEGIGSVVTGFGNMPDATQQAIAGFSAFLGIGLLSFGVFTRIATGLGTAATFLRDFGKEGSNADRATTALAGNLGVLARGVVGLGVFFAIAPQLEKLTGNFAQAGAAAGALAGTLVMPGIGTIAGAILGGIAGSLGLLGDEAGLSRDQVRSLGSEIERFGANRAAETFLEGIGLSAREVTAAFEEAKMPISDMSNIVLKVDENVGKFRKSFTMLAEEAPGAARKVLDDLTTLGTVGPAELAKMEASLAKGEEAWKKNQVAAAQVKALQDDLGASIGLVADGYLGAAGDVDTFADALDRVSGSVANALDANLKYVNSLVALGEALDKNGTSFNLSEEAGRKNTAALYDAIKAANDHAGKVYEDTQSVEAANATLSEHVSALVSSAEAHGVDTNAILTQIAAYEGIPDEVITTILTDTDENNTQQIIDEIIRRVNEGRPPPVPIDVDPAPANDKIPGVLGQLANIGAQRPTPSVDLNPDPFAPKSDGVLSRLADIGAQRPTPGVDLNPDPFAPKSDGVLSRLAEIGAQHPTPTADLSDNASGPLGGVLGLLESINGYEAFAYTRVTTEYVTVGTPQAAGGGGGGAWAHGGIVPGPAIPAQGGMVVPATPGGMRFVVGEAGSPEVILPTNDDRRALQLLRAAGLGRLIGGSGGGGGLAISAPIQIIVNASGNRRADIAAGRDAGTAAGRALLQTVRSQGRRS